MNIKVDFKCIIIFVSLCVSVFVVCVCITVGTHMPWNKFESQRTTLGSKFSSALDSKEQTQIIGLAHEQL